MPKYHRYNGTAVRVRTNVPIKNELVIQLIRSVGIRKIKGVEFGEGEFLVSYQASAEAKPPRFTSGKRATENHVFFCPGMNAAAMRTGQLLRFHFCGRPEFFFYGASGIGQL